jgi:hypothetical protein
LAHCKKENENQWKQEWGYKGYFSSHIDNSKGIAILISTAGRRQLIPEACDCSLICFYMLITTKI